MNRRSGFTLIEVLVTITIMVILMTLAIVNIRSTQVRARDSERKSDVESIARHLNSLYTSGFSFTYNSTAMSFKGRYPTTAEIMDTTARSQIFADLPGAILIDPIKSTSTQTFNIPVDNTESTADADKAKYGLSGDYRYVYQPLDDYDNLCVNDSGASPQNCRRFNLYYKTEYDNKVQMIRSVHQ